MASGHLTGIVEKFSAIGGDFVIPAKELVNKLDLCRAIVFDWDGVFNAGRKGRTTSSGFAEADSMGTNMLRYGLWRKLGKLPITAIITGENNAGAIEFAEREHFTGVYTGIHSKQHAIAFLCESNDLAREQIGCVFDDINDLGMARVCGPRFMVRSAARPLFADYVGRRALCDYVTGADASACAVREVCELLLGLMGSFDEVLDSRISRDADYEAYFKTRQAAVTQHYVQHDENIVLRD